METELKETIQNLLLQFMQNMHEWEVTCNDIENRVNFHLKNSLTSKKNWYQKSF